MLNILGVGLHRGFGRTAQRRCGSCLIAFSYMFLQGVCRVGFISPHGWRVGQQMSAFDICSARGDGMGWRKGDGFSDSWNFVSVFIFPSLVAEALVLVTAVQLLVCHFFSARHPGESTKKFTLWVRVHSDGTARQAEGRFIILY